MPRIRPTGEGSRSGLPTEGARAGSRSPQAVEFGSQLRAARLQQARTRLDEQIARIDQLGQQLAERMTIANLKAYREAVREFLEVVQREALVVESETEWDHRTWEQRTMTIVRKVNAELEALAEDLTHKEEGRLRLLARLGEIKGLLLDLRF